MDIELDGADQTASTEDNAASAASGEDTSEEDSLYNYNKEDEIAAAQKAAAETKTMGLRIEIFSEVRK